MILSRGSVVATRQAHNLEDAGLIPAPAIFAIGRKEIIMKKTIKLKDELGIKKNYIIPDIYASRDEDEEIILEMIFPKSRVSLGFGKDGSAWFSVVTENFASSGDFT